MSETDSEFLRLASGIISSELPEEVVLEQVLKAIHSNNEQDRELGIKTLVRLVRLEFAKRDQAIIATVAQLANGIDLLTHEDDPDERESLRIKCVQLLTVLVDELRSQPGP